jgi:Flp pilus assembly protein TadG
MNARFTRLLSRFRKDRRGIAAVEFAMILPVMLTFYLGTFEGSNAIIAKRKVDNAAETVGGIVARSGQMDATRMANALMISEAIIGSDDASAMTLTVTAVKVDSKGKATVHWSRKGKSAGFAVGAPFTLSGELKGLNDAYFIVATATYDFKPMFSYGGMIDSMRFERTFSFRPRKGSEIPWS